MFSVKGNQQNVLNCLYIKVGVNILAIWTVSFQLRNRSLLFVIVVILHFPFGLRTCFSLGLLQFPFRLNSYSSFKPDPNPPKHWHIKWVYHLSLGFGDIGMWYYQSVKPKRKSLNPCINQKLMINMKNPNDYGKI